MRKTAIALALIGLGAAMAAEAQPTLWANGGSYIEYYAAAKGRWLTKGPMGSNSTLFLGTAPSGTSNDAWFSIIGTLTGGEWAIYSTSTLPSILTGPLETGDAIGAKNGTGVTVAEYGDRAMHQTMLTLTVVSLTITDATTAGAHGSLKVYDFPAGPIQILGSSFNLTTLAGAGGIADGASLVGALGTVTTATDNATLTSTEADLIASYAGTLVAGAGVLTKHGSLIATAYDGHATAIDAYLNVAVPDADMTDAENDTLAVSGTITITWVNLGDY